MLTIIRNNKNIILFIIILIISLFIGYEYGLKKYNDGYKLGYSAGYAEKNKLIEVPGAVKTETKIVYEKIKYNGNDVQIKTEEPKVTVSINGKKQEIKKNVETADLAVKTETEVKLKIPERKWSVGIGTDGHKATYFLKAPIKNAVGVWVAGNKEKFMGGISVSF